MALPSAYRTLLESAQSQAKRLGHARVTTGHVALALCRSDPEEAQRRWNELTEADIAAGCFAGVPKGDLGRDAVDREPAEVLEVLEQAARGHAFDDLYASLAETLELTTLHAATATAPSDAPASSDQAHAVSAGPSGPRPEPIAVAPRPPFDPVTAREALLDAVIAQEHAVDALVKRLILTQAQLDLRPERPDGVFLFAGPTGVGKTELAKALSEVLSPGNASLIRLDMSEYQDGSMAVAKLIGSGPGFVGHDEPSSWLTTRVNKNPFAVILLDEIEKAHPSVWTVFLQVFDDGRLTDGRGATADFSNTVIVMTSNIGARLFDSRPLGFQSGDGAPRTPRDDVMHEIRKTMPPELFNRIDETVVFRSLDRSDIRDVAAKHIAAAVVRLGERGYELRLADDVVDFIAVEGFDPDLGARHLLRNVERLLLSEAAIRGPGTYGVTVDHDAGVLVWSS